MLRIGLAFLMLCLVTVGAWADATIPTKDKEGAKDNPLLKRYEGSFIVADDGKSFDEFVLPLGPLKADAEGERRDQQCRQLRVQPDAVPAAGRVGGGDPGARLQGGQVAVIAGWGVLCRAGGIEPERGRPRPEPAGRAGAILIRPERHPADDLLCG